MKLRGYLTLCVVAAFLVVADLLQRTVITLLVTTMPGRRDRILGRWQRWIAHAVLGLVSAFGGARTGRLPSIPGRPGVLVLMNHQSLLDIPIVVASMDGLYPRIVTRDRYARGKPLISHMVRLYQYPTVNPRATVRGDVERLGEAAARSPVPIAIFPEGTRTRDGSLGRFKRAGLTAILSARPWSVYLLVVDGYWQAATLRDFLTSVSEVDGEVRCLGPFERAAGEDAGDFIERMRSRMAEALEEMRGRVAA